MVSLEKMKKEKVHSSSNHDVHNGEVVKKERHIVSWSQEEDDILREQIRLHGSENWAIIVSKFKDKTTRQCRRRWFTYLNSDFKKGGWSPEEDILLCEAQRMYGNRWTEIAKVVSGRTDNAVKNRFTTLCKKKATHEASVKVNSTTSYVNLNNKRVIFHEGLSSDEGSENDASLKKIRAWIPSITEYHNHGEKYAVECVATGHLLDHPFAAIARNVQSSEVSCLNEALIDKSMENRFISMILNKDDPKVLALTQQAELLSSLAIKINTDKTNQSLENAWMVLEDFLKQNKECQMVKATNGDTDFQQKKFKEPEEDSRSCNEGSRSSWRELQVNETSTVSSEHSIGSTLLSNESCYESEECDAEIGHILQTEKLEHNCPVIPVKSMPTYEDVKTDNTEFNSPTHVTPSFRTLAAAIPTPKFSESEKHFLLKTLGLESTSPSPITNSSQPPSCKRSLLHCL